MRTGIYRRFIRAAPATLRIVAAVSMLSVSTGRLHAAPRMRSVSGTAHVQLEPGSECTSPLGICTTGTIFGDLRGTIAGTAIRFDVPADESVPTVGTFVNRIVIRTVRGDLMCTEVGAANTAGAGEFVSLCEITDSTGELAGTSGYLRFRGVFSPATGGTYRYEGELLRR